jgi:hypothetical protein
MNKVRLTDSFVLYSKPLIWWAERDRQTDTLDNSHKTMFNPVSAQLGLRMPGDWQAIMKYDDCTNSLIAVVPSIIYHRI